MPTREEIRAGLKDTLRRVIANTLADGYNDLDSIVTEIQEFEHSQGLAFVYDIQAPAFGKQWAKFEPLIEVKQ